MKKILSIFLIMLTMQVFSQEKSISGSVKDETGQPLIGVTILIKGVAKGTITDFDGNYTINALPNNVLVFSYLGTETKEVTVGNQRTINVTLTNSDMALDEVVVIGYGTAKKSDLSGAVSSVKAEDISKIGAIGIEQALSGMASGVVVSQASGAPGSSASIVIRGLSSLSSSEPLYVIDGVPMDNTASPGLGDGDLESSTISPLSLINPEDIESIEILKDASSTAIYGSRGANGVVLITTKTGKTGKGIISIDHDYSVVEVPNFIELLDANEYTILNNESKVNVGVAESTSQRLDSARAGLLQSTNWQKTIMSLGKSANTNINFSGGNQDLNYLISTNILSAEGVVVGTDLDRITTRVNLRASVSDKLKVGTSINYAHVTSNQRSINTGTSTDGNTSAINRAFSARPYLNYEDEVDDPDDAETLDGFSPLTSLEANQYTNLLTQIVGSLDLEYEFNKNFTLKTALTHQNRNTAQRYYQFDLLGRFSEGGRAKTSDTRNTSSTITNTLDYNTSIGKHKITVLLGQSLESAELESIRVSNFGFPNDLLTYYAPETATFNDPDYVGYSKTNLSSWFGRIGYNYKSKFIATLTGRYEGSSKFSANNQWAFFPAAAVAYNVSKEKFMKKIDFINQLKLRASYGFSGNQAIQPYQSLNQYAAGITGFNETLTTFYSPNQIPNDNLTWETTSQLNFAIDYGLLKNKISGSFEYYLKETNDILFADNAAAIQSGFATYTENFGQLQTEGFEMDITARIINKEKFSWTLKGNLGTGKTIITDMASDYIQSGWDPGYIPGGTQRLIIGEEVGAFYGYKTTAIAQFDDFVEFQGLSNQEQINKYNADPFKGDYTYVAGFDKGVPFTNIQNRPGEQLYEDLDGSGDFNEADRQVIGRAQPDITFGVNNTFEIGNVDFSFFFDSQIGKEIAAIQNMRLLEFADRQALAIATQRWTPENPSTVYPRVSMENRETIFSSRYIEDGSFVRLQNITIGYTFPKDVIEKLKLSSLRIFASGSNLYTWTNYTGYSPDVSIRGSATKAIGHDKGGYPLARTIRMGIKLKF
ncbi:TonB-linked SusC/RagA family outer membrane protein [Mariniflexile fucanivorans]|uniref:TonB-linked SusC/RagA family outer membrane protein n=1 Tax=Mariniflexile fucanivorans TaxID=264023 RepID=A0A4R1RMP4_9FLAO|nr:TonB-dependent receptor [Mariniflexile fucanivorans]TCL67466.1 TonB-linked SusC/RagA family outer membrane protein [Mariniflexile fucanivorans]